MTVCLYAVRSGILKCPKQKKIPELCRTVRCRATWCCGHWLWLLRRRLQFDPPTHGDSLVGKWMNLRHAMWGKLDSQSKKCWQDTKCKIMSPVAPMETTTAPVQWWSGLSGLATQNIPKLIKVWDIKNYIICNIRGTVQHCIVVSSIFLLVFIRRAWKCPASKLNTGKCCAKRWTLQCTYRAI